MSGQIQAGYVWFECPECEFSSVQKINAQISDECPLCAGDSGHKVHMKRRPAVDTDMPEGHDARKMP